MLTGILREIRSLGATFVRGVRQPFQQLLLSVVVIMMTIGVAFYSWQENWSVIDSLYFTVIALTTVGFGDFAPTTALSRLFTIFYVLAGIGIFGVAINAIVSRQQQRVRERRESRSDDAGNGLLGNILAERDQVAVAAAESREAQNAGTDGRSMGGADVDVMRLLTDQAAALEALRRQLQAVEEKLDRSLDSRSGPNDGPAA